MRQYNRIKWLKVAQQTATTTATPTTPPTILSPPNISIISLPGFKSNLFQVKPEIIQHLEKIINILNKYIYTLSKKSITFNQAWTNPSVSGSEYSNDLKHLVDISKWIYITITSNTVKQYDEAGLVQFIKDLRDNISQRSFQYTTVKPEIVNECQVMLNLFGA